MTGVKGRSGGPRPNSGGARPGAGRKAKPKVENVLPAVPGQSPLDFLLAVVNNAQAAPHLRVRAAVAAAQYVHVKKADGGKKDDAKAAAKKAGKGKFAPGTPPLRLL